MTSEPGFVCLEMPGSQTNRPARNQSEFTDTEGGHKAPPVLRVWQVGCDVRERVYYLLYSDRRLIKCLRHVSPTDLEDPEFMATLWRDEIAELSVGADGVWLLCRSWARPESLGLDPTDTSLETRCGLVAVYSVSRVARNLTGQPMRLPLPDHIPQGHAGAWHIAVFNTSLLVYVEGTECVHHFWEGKWEETLPSSFALKNVSKMELRDDLVFVGQPQDHKISVYRWRSENMPLVYEVKNACEGFFTVIGSTVVITRIINEQPPPSTTNKEQAAPLIRTRRKLSLLSNRNRGTVTTNINDDETTAKPVYRMQFTDVGTKDSFSREVNFNFMVMAALYSGKVILYNLDTNSLEYFSF